MKILYLLENPTSPNRKKIHIAHGFLYSHVVKNDIKLAVVLYAIYCHLLAHLHGSFRRALGYAITNACQSLTPVLYIHMV